MAAAIRISPSYILAGPETGKKQKFLADLVSACAQKDGQDPERHRLYAPDSPPDQVVGLLRNGSLFASRKVVEYRDVDTITAKAGIETLASYLANPVDDAILVLITEGYSLSKALESKVAPNDRIIFWELRENEKPAWIRERLARDQLSADESAVEAMLELVEPDTGALEAACLTLGACFAPGARLDADAVEAALSRSRREDAFSLFDRMAEGDLDASLSTLDAILADRQGDAAQILAGLVWSFRKLERLHGAADSGSGLDDAFVKEKVTSKTGQRKFRTAARRYSAKDCQTCLRALSETEALLRGGMPAMLTRPLLHLLVDALVRARGSGLVLSGWKEREYYQAH